MGRWLKTCDRWLRRAENAAAALAILILILVTLAVCAEVVLRYGLNDPIVWIVEVTEYALLYITFLGTAWTLRRGGHVRVDLFLLAMPRRVELVCGLLTSLIGLAIALVLTVFGAEATWDAYERGLFKPTNLEAPTWIVLLAIPVGAALLIGRFALNLALYAHALGTGTRLAGLADDPTP